MSLLNMLIIGGLLFLSLVALERMNTETSTLFKELDLIAIEISKGSSVQETAATRQLENEKVDMSAESVKTNEVHKRMASNIQATHRATLDDGFNTVLDGIESVKTGVTDLDELVRNVKKTNNTMISRMEVTAECQYLQNIIAELRDQSNSKKILGIAVDRVMLGRFFGGVVGIMYIIMKEFADQLINRAKELTPMGALLSRVGAMGEDGQPICGGGMEDHEESLLNFTSAALNFSASCVLEHCIPGCAAPAEPQPHGAGGSWIEGP